MILTWAERCEKFDDGEIITERLIQEVMQEEIDELRELQTLVKSFFEDYLNYQEESDSGRVFNPIHVSCTRAMMIEPLAKLLMRMKELSGVKQ
jgi:hypothetical protein